MMLRIRGLRSGDRSVSSMEVVRGKGSEPSSKTQGRGRDWSDKMYIEFSEALEVLDGF